VRGNGSSLGFDIYHPSIAGRAVVNPGGNSFWVEDAVPLK
jgi:hypothetical protein